MVELFNTNRMPENKRIENQCVYFFPALELYGFDIDVVRF